MKTTITLLFGTLLGLGIYHILSPNESADNTAQREAKPLYWVAPMDDNYRRNEPGLSPMGMELVPVYADDNKGIDAGPGTIQISPQVQNQLGVKTTEVAYGVLNQSLMSQGTLRYADTGTQHLHTKSTGWIKDLQVKSVGDWVEKGQLLYTLYVPDWVNAQQELLFAIKQNNETLIQATQMRLKVLQLPERVINQIQQQRKIIENVPFYALQAGYVTQLNVQSGHVAHPGETLMVISDTQTLWLDVEWFPTEASNIKANMDIQARTAFYPNRQWRGRIDHIYPNVDPQNRSLLTRISIDNSDGSLKANMAMNINAIAEYSTPVLLVPREAVIQLSQQQRVVLALGDGSFKSVAVQLGQQDDRFYQVISGLKAGDEVVTSAQFLIDSESSKTSDFIRMGERSWPQAQVKGKIIATNPEQRQFTIHREAITKWQRPAATMRFLIENHLNMTGIEVGDSISFTFEIRDGDFVITQLQVISHD